MPSFLWILLGAPHVERLRGNPRWQAASTTLTAAVVGVVASLAVWFGRHVLWPPGQPVNGFGIVLAVLAFLGLTRWRWPLIPVVLGAAVIGTLRRLAL